VLTIVVLRLLQCLDDKEVQTSLFFLLTKLPGRYGGSISFLVAGIIKLWNKGYCLGNNYGGSIYMEGHDMEPPY